MAETVIRNLNPYSNPLTFENEWVTGFVTYGNDVNILLQIPYPYTDISSHNFNIRTYDAASGWLSCTLREIKVTHQGIDITVVSPNMSSNYGKALLFELNGTIVLS